MSIFVIIVIRGCLNENNYFVFAMTRWRLSGRSLWWQKTFFLLFCGFSTFSSTCYHYFPATIMRAQLQVTSAPHDPAAHPHNSFSKIWHFIWDFTWDLNPKKYTNLRPYLMQWFYLLYYQAYIQIYVGNMYMYSAMISSYNYAHVIIA